MTNKEAISILQGFKDSGTYDNDAWEIDPEMNEALFMAIKALYEQEKRKDDGK